jgi:uncharacterized membrane protein
MALATGSDVTPPPYAVGPDEIYTPGGPRRGRRHGAARLAQSLGWFSVGLGLAEVCAPRQLARAIGLAPRLPRGWVDHLPRALTRGLEDEHTATLRLFGLREIGTGLAILTRRRPTGSLWARVAGDVLDLGLLGSALRRAGGNRRRLVTAAAAVAGVTALDVLAGQRLAARRRASRTVQEDGRVRVVHSIAVNRAPEDCYGFWRRLENAPRFMRHIAEVTVDDDRHSHWRARGPAGMRLEWRAEITEDAAPKLIAWRSVNGSMIGCEGSVRFLAGPRGRGTLVRAALQYEAPAGAIGDAVARLFGSAPDQQLREDLRRFKQLLEVGTVITTDGQPSGVRRGAVARLAAAAAA